MAYPGAEEALLRYLSDAYDAWIGLGDPGFQVRKFRDVLLSVFGVPHTLDALGGSLHGMVVVETDGSYQLLDVLHTCGEDIVSTPFNVRDDALASVAQFAAARLPPPATVCRRCSIFAQCGGGYQPHRWNGVDFDRPSVYCDVMKGLVGHIRAHLQQVTPAECWRPVAANAGQQDAGGAEPAHESIGS
jgi:uncharacterized protein